MLIWKLCSMFLLSRNLSWNWCFFVCLFVFVLFCFVFVFVFSKLIREKRFKQYFLYGKGLLEGHRPIFQNSVFSFIRRITLQRYKFKISVEMVKLVGCTNQFCILQLPIPYCVCLTMIKITRHVFINIFQKEHFSAGNLTWVMRKIWAFLWYHNLQKLEKKVEKIGLGYFNT